MRSENRLQAGLALSPAVFEEQTFQLEFPAHIDELIAAEESK